MIEPGKYLYCIINCSEDRTFQDVASIGDVDSPVYTIPYDGLAAVVSDSLVTDYDCTRANLLAHQRVQERVMKESSLLPVRFGTVADPEFHSQDVLKLLKKRHSEFCDLLSDIEGKIELGLKALWQDEKAIYEEILRENPSLKKLRDSIEGRPPQATHFERIRLGELVKSAIDQKRASEAGGILTPLSRVALRTVENQIVMDRMIVNAAFLVDKEQETNFDHEVGRLDEQLGQRVAFKYVGPVPPYNFVNIVVNWQELRKEA